MKIAIKLSVAGTLLAATMLFMACGKDTETAQQSDNVEVDATAQKRAMPASATPKKIAPDNSISQKSDNLCTSLKTTTPERLTRLFQPKKPLLPVDVASAGVSFGTACKYWEEGKLAVHQVFIKTDASAKSFEMMKKGTFDKYKELGVKSKPIEVQDPAFDDLFFTEFKTRWFTQTGINARKGNLQVVTTSTRSREELIAFAKDIFAELK